MIVRAIHCPLNVLWKTCFWPWINGYLVNSSEIFDFFHEKRSRAMTDLSNMYNMRYVYLEWTQCCRRFSDNSFDRFLIIWQFLLETSSESYIFHAFHNELFHSFENYYPSFRIEMIMQSILCPLVISLSHELKYICSFSFFLPPTYFSQYIFGLHLFSLGILKFSNIIHLFYLDL